MKIIVVFNSIQFLLKFKLKFVNDLSFKHDIYLLLPNNQQPINDLNKNITIYTTPLNSRGRNPFKDALYVYNIIKLVKIIRPNLIMSFTIKPNIYSGIVSKIYRIHHIMTISGLGSAYHSNKIPKWLYFYFYSLAIGKRTIAMYENEHIDQVFKANRLRFVETKVINGSGVDLDNFEIQIYPESKPVRFLYIGRLMNEKGIRELLSATMSLLNQNYDFELHLVGEVTSEISGFLSKTKTRFIGNEIKFIGYVNDVSSVIKESHVIVHPSYHEGMANALLEGAACGRPLLASNIPGCREIIEHNVNGFLFEPRNQIELENSMKKIMSLDLNQLNHMGLASREKVELFFDRKLINMECMNLIEKIASGSLA